MMKEAVVFLVFVVNYYSVHLSAEVKFELI